MKKIKILVLLSSIVFIYIIYNFNNKNYINYVALGDNLALGENSYGMITYSYSDYFKDYLEKNKKLTLYTKDYSKKKYTIKNLYNDILLDSKIQIGKYTYNIKQVLRDSDILSISIGLNDIIYEYNTTNKLLTEYQEDRIIDNVFFNYKELINEIKKYYTKKIYILGYYTNNTKYDNLILKLNKKYKNYASKNNFYYIDISDLGRNKDYFDNPNSYYPNANGYRKIAEKLIKTYEK